MSKPSRRPSRTPRALSAPLPACPLQIPASPRQQAADASGLGTRPPRCCGQRLAIDTEFAELLPPVAQGDTTHLEHGASTGDDPAHTGTFHAVFDDTAASPFDDAGGDGEAMLEGQTS